MVLFYILIPISLAAVLIVLGMGVFSMARPDNITKEQSNKLMRYRVLFQAIAIVLILLFVAVASMGAQ